VLFTASLRDEALPDVERQVYAMAKQIPNCRIFFANHGGHPLMWSQPEDFRRVADCFLGPLMVEQGFAVDNLHDTYEGDAGSMRIGNVVDPCYTVVSKFPKAYFP